ncbi:hypothetical protein EMCRGX_G032244 [Ephydatia muelleri]|eukprot:Em0019g614a
MSNYVLAASGLRRACSEYVRCSVRRSALRFLLARRLQHSEPELCKPVQVKIGDSNVTFSTGRYANLADGAALVQSGNTAILVTAVSGKKPQSVGFLPLQVDYRERASAAGRIPQNFLRRELRVSDREILASRFIDRSVRPLFPSGYTYETQVICDLLAVDGRHDAELLSVLGTSAALMLSDIPWNGPIGAVRVGLIGDQLCINPTQRELEHSSLNIIVSCTKDRIVMVEGGANEVDDARVCEAVMFGFEQAQPVISCLERLREIRRKPTRAAFLSVPPADVAALMSQLCRPSINTILTDFTLKKASRDERLFTTLDSASSVITQSYPTVSSHILSDAFWSVCRQCLQENVVVKGIRCDGRGLHELRPIECCVDVFEPLHGSASFRRGETQVLCTVTFDSPHSAARADVISTLLGAQKSRRFMVHYEFPPFATNTTGPFMLVGRREVGHGALAEKALLPLIPKDFPFTIRLSSQVVDSNGSSSMATVCGGSLALFDAGVPLKRAVAGVACGLVTTDPKDGNIDNYQILTDILGIEDALGYMDFKSAGTEKGVTSLQMDIKSLPGIPYSIFKEAMMRSRDARHEVLQKMAKCQSVPRAGIKENGPAYATIDLPVAKRMKLIGTGGHRIRSLIDDTGAQVQTVSDEAMSIFAPSRDVMEQVMERIEDIISEDPAAQEPELKFGSIIDATIKEVRDYGFIVELAPGIGALLHVSQISHKFVSHPSDLGLEVGHKICVKYFGRDPVNGKHRISRKALLNIPVEPAAARGQEAGDQLLTEVLENSSVTDKSAPSQSKRTDH